MDHQTLDIFCSVLQTNDNGYLLTGVTVLSNYESMDVLLVKLEPEEENQPPSAPIIDGPANGKVSTAYPYTFISNDPEGDQISYYIEWGDGKTTDWTAFRPSGPPGYSESHSWNIKGTYTIQAKAKDIYGAESDWGTLTVTMPYSYNPIRQFFDWLFQRFPNAFPILRYLMRY